MSRSDDDRFDRPLTARDDEETLFSRNVDGQLVRLDVPTEKDYDTDVTLTIDGKSVTVRAARPLTDAQGNVVLDVKGCSTPRYTTIYDAATELYVHAPGEESNVPMPTLCHQPHLAPVAVCRLCVVQLYGRKDGERRKERKLLPACQHRVEDGMEVFTMHAPRDTKEMREDGDRVRRVVQVMTELLVADHLKDAPTSDQALRQELEDVNELKRAAQLFGLERGDLAPAERERKRRFADAVFAAPASSPRPRPLDESSPVFIVDRSACILCDRCSRACDDVKHNDVIGRVGKGRTAAIGFDLDADMGKSTCVQCGECMVSCPTTAITFRKVAKVDVTQDSRHAATILTAPEMRSDPLLAALPPKFLLWQDGLAVRRQIRADTTLCSQGDPGNTAYIIKKGRFKVTAWPTGRDGAARPSKEARREPPKRWDRGPEDLILGEMSCLSNGPRSADVVATTDAEVWEVRRNVVDRLMRSPVLRESFEDAYRRHALELVMNESQLFQQLDKKASEDCAKFLGSCLEFVRVSPRQVIFEQGDESDCMYLIRVGHVRVTRVRDKSGELKQDLYRAAGSVIGEMGLLALSDDDIHRPTNAVCDRIGALLHAATPGRLGDAWTAAERNATCVALDHVQLVRIGRESFLTMLRDYRPVLHAVVGISQERLAEDRQVIDPFKWQFIEQGLYQGQSLLVLDLDRCTRCDECTRACVQQHGVESHGVPLTRLVREGLQFDNYLVATACRSCKDAYCMIGCPVDAIHRGRHQQIVIEDHCIGCGLCERNCPYGNIQTVASETDFLQVPDSTAPGRMRAVARAKAATCDLCDAGGNRETPLPRCVFACPHDAAHRMTGDDLLKIVQARHKAETKDG